MNRSISHTIIKLIFCVFVSFGATKTSGQAPVANFNGSPLSGCSPLIVSFTDLSSGNPTSWSWNFGNGNTSTLKNPTASYFTPGSYTVTLTATNANGSNTIIKNQYITVYESPTVNFSGTPLSGCFPLTVQFTDLSTPGNGNSNTAWLWDFGNGTTSTQQNPSVTYTTAGNYSVTLRVTNNRGCSKTFSRPSYVSVQPGVVAAFTNSTAVECRPPSNINFTNNSSGPGPLSYNWTFGDGGTSTLANPSHVYTTSGTFVVTLTVTSPAGCQATVQHTVVIGGTTTSFTFTSPLCPNDLASFINTSTPAPIVSRWYFGDGGTATTINTSHRYTTAGTYTVTLYNTYASCMDSISQTVTVLPFPVADFTAPDTAKCQPPLTVNFQDLTAGSTTWQWDFGDGGTSTLQNPSHTYNAFGTYNVKLIVTNAAGCMDSIVKPGYVVIRRSMISIPLFPDRGCLPHTISPIPVINAVDNILTYNWDFGDGGTSTLQFPTHTYITQGTYTVRLIITTSDGCTDTLTVPQAVKVGTKPIADFSGTPTNICAGQPVQFTDLSAPADQWIWDFGDQNTSILQNPEHRYRDTGYFTVQLIAYNSGCADTIIKSNYIYVLPPVARFGYFVPDCNNRLFFNFVDSSILPLSWAWDFGDGGTSTNPNPGHTFPAIGAYSVRLIVTNGGCADTLIKTVKAIDEQPDFTANITTACKAVNIGFIATNVDVSNISSYFWDFGLPGDTATVTIPSTNHTYTISGNYSIKLRITDINGCTDSIIKTNYIRVNGPLASFNSTNLHGCLGTNTLFNDLSSTDGVHPIVNWQWDFGDGTVQNFSAPPFQHMYNLVDTFSVKLIITDAIGCKDSILVNDAVITSGPSALFFVSDTVSCVGADIQFNTFSQPAGTLIHNWYYGDGGTGSGANPFHAYADTGRYTIKLVVVDPWGCSDSLIRNQYIRIARPKAQFSTSDTASSCAPFEVQFTNNSTFFNSLLWDFGPGEGTSPLYNPNHYFSAPGTYNVKLLIISPGGCRDSAYQTIIVYDTAGSRVDYLPLSGCKPLSVNLNSFTPGVISSYLWDFGDGYTDTTTTPNVSHVYKSYGDFIPKVIMEDPTGCMIPVTGITMVHVTGANANFGTDDSLYCDLATVSFTDSTTFNEAVTNYSWSFGDGGISNAQNPVHNYANPGLYTVQLQVRTLSNCLDTFTKTNYINVVQSPVIDIGGDSTLCINTSAVHNGIFIIPDTSQVAWSWSFPNGANSSLQNPPAQIYTTAGNFIIRAIAINSSGCRDTSWQNIYVNPLPVATMPGQMTVQNGFPVQIPVTYSPNTASWNWTPATGLSCTNCPAPIAGPKFNTLYQVYFTDDKGCSNSASILVTTICKNMNLFIPNTFSPNGDGNNDIFYPRGKGLDRMKLLRVFNRWGEVVFEKRDCPVNDPSSGWNGTYKGQRPIAGVYIYQAEVFCENGELIILNGNVALIL